VRRSSAGSIPIADGQDAEGDPGGNGSPAPARARGQAPADTAEPGEQTLQRWRGEPRVTWRKLSGLQSQASRSMAGFGRQRLSARWTCRPGQRTAGATAARPAPPKAGGEGRRGPPPSRGDGLGACPAGWPTGRKSEGHSVGVGGRGWASQPQGAGPQGADESRGRGGETCYPDAVHRADWRAGSPGNGAARFGGGPGEKARQRPRPRPTQSRASLPLPAAAQARRWAQYDYAATNIVLVQKGGGLRWKLPFVWR
jgi:hypothetical protein